LSADEIPAENKEQIDADPTEAVDPAGKRKSHDPGVVKRDDKNGERAEKIEAGLAFTIRETRIDGYCGFRFINSQRLATRKN
jgi:hypothetical protein